MSISKSILYKILLFLSLFAFFYPEHYVFMPFPTIRLVQIIGLIYSFFYFYRHPSLFFRYRKMIKYGVIIFILGFCSAYIFNANGDLDVAKRGVLLILHLFTCLWITFLLRKSAKRFSVYALLEWLVVITLVQAFVSFTFLLFPSISDAYWRLVVTNEIAQKKLEEFMAFRLIGIGDMRFATAAVHYGLMMWGVITLRYVEYGIWGRYKILPLLVVAVFSLAGILSGRMFFVVLGLTYIYMSVLYNMKFEKAVKEMFKIFFPTIIAGLVLFVYVFAQNEELVAWAFEIFINYAESGEITSSSTNDLQSMYIFPREAHTWIVGDGKSVNQRGGFYMSTDVGYIRSLYYWGLIGTIIYYVIQYKCCRLFTRMCSSRVLRIYVMFFFVMLMVYSLKDFYSIEKYIALFISVQTVIYWQLKKKRYECKIYNSNTGL